ncbi:hypothetical protein P7K49_024489 [Saguinus oedipus]|uniref:LIM zinc-binding domain-containing protein n=1 Tax=Saguinus oedipus TaxID=9490 RepID=A0ABQ9URA7_SAGOE|nr:hypothetical protein P7K49_024489 [Saguinus oedipus]
MEVHKASVPHCAGCGRDIKNGQALLALDKQWHLGCFKCKCCGKVLTGEYISKDGAPYCEKDYQGLFGVKCEACHQFITGKVLEGERSTSLGRLLERMDRRDPAEGSLESEQSDHRAQSAMQSVPPHQARVHPSSLPREFFSHVP